LLLQITGAGIASDGTIQAQFTISDPEGLPLDRTGVDTAGTVSISLIAAVLANGQNDYVSLAMSTRTICPLCTPTP
jgi:hypothetical protein